MAPSLEQRLAALRNFDPDGPKALEIVRTGLRATAGVIVEGAAKLVGEHRLDALVPELVDAFARLPDKDRDPGCRGKLAIAHAMHALDRWDDRIFVAGLTIVQPEGWKPTDDTAAALRGVCGIAHAHANRADALDVLAGLLADPERAARLGAAQGLGDSNKIGATALLRYKILAGDADPEVTSACVESLIALDREACLDFLLGLLATADQRAEIVALALGGARIEAARAALTAWCEAARPAQRQRVAYLALALLRDDAATAHLLDAIRTRSKHDAIAAARALATFKDDKLAAQIQDAAKSLDAATRREIEAVL